MSYSYPPRTPAGSNAKVPGFQWLRADPNADVQHVDLRVLRALNNVGAALHRVITITSGYRDPAYSQKVGGYADDPHTRGVAADVQIGGQPIGSYPGALRLLALFGLESGAQPGFYKGQSDPEHVQIPGSGANKTLHALATLAGLSGAPPSPSDSSLPPLGSPTGSSASASPSPLDVAGAGCGGVLAVMFAAWAGIGAAAGYSLGWWLR